ncbi:MAG: DUF5050 domain-containing protein [Bacillota bacterium]
MKKPITIASCLFLLFMAFTASSARANPGVYYNGKKVTFDVPPVIEDGRALVPLRALFETLGARVDWDGTERTVTAQKGEKIIKITIGSREALVNDRPAHLDVAAKIIDGRTLVPIRFVSEVLGADVSWDETTETITITDQQGGNSTISPGKSSETPAQKANTNGNIQNRALISIQGDWIYYSNFQDDAKLYKIKTNGKEKTKLNDLPSMQINVVGDWIYYTTGSARSPYSTSEIYKIRTNGTENTKIGEYNALYMQAVDGFLYFGGDRLYRMPLDGSEPEVLNENEAMNVNVMGDWIYCTSHDSAGKNKIYRVSTDGNIRMSVSDEDVLGVMQVADGWIYYTSSGDGKLYKIRTDGTEKTPVGDDQVKDLNIDGEWIFYSNLSDRQNLYRMKTDGSSRKRLSNHPAECINLLDGWVYYYNAKTNQLFQITDTGIHRYPAGEYLFPYALYPYRNW